MSDFVHLRLHSEYSMRDGLVRIADLVQHSQQMQLPAVVITDHSNLFAMVKLYTSAIKNKLKPIIAADVIVRDDDEHFLLTLYCQNQTGYHNLTWLLSQAYLKGQQTNGDPELQREWIEGHSEGLIALSGGLHGDIGQALIANKEGVAKKRLQYWCELFPDRFYLELVRTHRPREEEYVHAAVALALELDVPVVATNDVRFINQTDFEAHEARVCIHDSYILEDKNRPRRYSEHQYLKTKQEMSSLFADIPEALENTVEIAKRCNLKITLGEVFLPQFPIPENYTIESYLTELSFNGLRDYLQKKKPGITDEQQKEYEARLQLELDVIIQMGFPGYFLIVADFIRWAKENKIPVGPGRGSGAGSLVAFALRITTLDPLDHELLFERFLNPERVSMPDFDIDFCMERRDLVIDYVARRYGRDAVSQIITYGTMAAKAVVRDVGRVLGLSYGFCDKLAKLIPFEIGMTLEKAMLQEEELSRRYREEEEVTTLIDLARTLEGITRNAGKHAGGVVIAPGKLTDFAPLYCESDGSNLVTQFDKNDVEAVGLVKFDFLGLRTLTIIDWAIQTINAKRSIAGEALIDIDEIPTDDPAVFKLLQNCETTAVFQLESRGMKELVKRLRPDCFDDITALVALFRPGPLQSGMVDDYIDCKHGRAEVHYPHPDIKHILKPTNGVILYQEQVMQIAQVLANYTLGGADLLRRAMGKKKPEEMAKQRSIFVNGAIERGIESATAEHIFDLMEKFAGYGFNKSHSAAYALIAYQTAWLKAHYPSEFMAAVLSSDMDNTDKVVGFAAECERMTLKVIPPNANQGEYQFTVNEAGDIIYGLGAIKGVGQAAIEHIVAQRQANGPFTSFYEFCQRIDLHKVNRRVLEALIKSGALDEFKVQRAVLFASINRGMKLADQKTKSASLGQGDMFGGVDLQETSFDIDYAESDPWCDQEKLQYEKQVLGMYISGHPFASYARELSHCVSAAIADLRYRRSKFTTIAGLLVAQRLVITKSGRRMGIIKLEDHTGEMEVTLFSKLYEEVKPILLADRVLIVRGKLEEDNFTGGVRMVAEAVKTLDHYRQETVKKLVLSIVDENQVAAILDQLPELVRGGESGSCPLAISYRSHKATAELQLGQSWRVVPSEALIRRLEQLCGQEAVDIVY